MEEPQGDRNAMIGVDVILVTFNSQRDIAECVNALLMQEDVNLHIIIVDNASSDCTVEILRAEYPQIKILSNSTNLGYSKACNVGLRFLSHDYVAFVNPDNIGDSKWIASAIEVLGVNPTVGGCQAKLLLANDRSRLNSRGNQANILFFGWPDGYMELDESPLKVVTIPFASGGASIYTRSCIEECGGYDETHFVYGEDLELGLRLFLYGYDVVLSPDSVVYHKYEFRPSPEKYFHLEKGRILIFLKIYHWRTVLFMLPLFVLTELAVLAKAAFGGWLPQKLRSYLAVLLNLEQVMGERRKVQTERVRSDGELVRLLRGSLSFAPLGDSGIVTIWNRLLEKYRDFLLLIDL